MELYPAVHLLASTYNSQDLDQTKTGKSQAYSHGIVMAAAGVVLKPPSPFSSNTSLPSPQEVCPVNLLLAKFTCRIRNISIPGVLLTLVKPQKFYSPRS